MTLYSFFDLATGQLLYSISSPYEDYITRFPVGTGIVGLVGEYVAAKHYYTNGSVISRPLFNLTIDSSVVANITDEAVITGIPSGTSVTWPDGVVTVETDGQVEFSTDTPGSYTFKFELWPYQVKEVTIEAVAAV